MWGGFALAVLLGALVLFVPGFLFLRGLGLRGLASIAVAPLACACAYNIWFAVAGMLGIRMSWGLALLPICILALVTFLAGKFARRNADCGVLFDEVEVEGAFVRRAPVPFDVLGCSFAVLCGIAVTVGVFVVGLAEPGSYVQSFDNVHHLGSIRAFVESGDWSSLGAVLYLGSDAAYDPFIEGSFYPSGWHAMAAFLVQCAGLTVTASANAVNVLFPAIVSPVGMYYCLRSIMPDKPWAAWAS